MNDNNICFNVETDRPQNDYRYSMNRWS